MDAVVQARMTLPDEQGLDRLDRELIRLTQAGLPLCPRPYAQLAAQLGITADEVVARLHRMLDQGMIRRIGAVPNHYRLGYRANGMSVWDVDDAHMEKAGAVVGALPFVSHCYQRPRHPPVWRYNLFAMVHGRHRRDVEAQCERIAALLGDAQHGHEILYSTRILKKSGFRLRD